MGAIFEIIGLILFSSVKFLFAPSTAYALGYTFWQTILISLIGGWLGVFVFYFAGSFVQSFALIDYLFVLAEEIDVSTPGLRFQWRFKKVICIKQQ